MLRHRQRTLRVSKAVVLAIGSLWLFFAGGQSFAEDVLVSDANIPMHDPEFNRTTNQFVWSDPIGQVWIGEVDRATCNLPLARGSRWAREPQG
jgi:hypothetical protein